MDPIRYRELKRIGRGGEADVFEAEAFYPDRSYDRVAMRRFRGTLSVDLRAFEQEAEVLSMLQHPSIVRLLDFVHGDPPYQILELVEGLNLRELLFEASQRCLLPNETAALFIVGEIAAALHYAHECKLPDGTALELVHRDVSPDNILISWTGEVKLSDFGAALASVRARRTASGLARGKLRYMAPEQLLGRKIDRRADVFSLGCVLWEMVAPSSFFREGIGAAMASNLETSSSLPSELAQDIAQIIRACSCASPNARYRTAEAVARACRTALARRGNDPRRVLIDWLSALSSNAMAHRPALARLFEISTTRANTARTPGELITLEDLPPTMPDGLPPITPELIDPAPLIELPQVREPPPLRREPAPLHDVPTVLCRSTTAKRPRDEVTLLLHAVIEPRGNVRVESRAHDPKTRVMLSLAIALAAGLAASITAASLISNLIGLSW